MVFILRQRISIFILCRVKALFDGYTMRTTLDTVAHRLRLMKSEKARILAAFRVHDAREINQIFLRVRPSCCAVHWGSD